MGYSPIFTLGYGDNYSEDLTSVVLVILIIVMRKKVQVGKDQEKAQSEKDSHSKNRGGKKPN